MCSAACGVSRNSDQTRTIAVRRNHYGALVVPSFVAPGMAQTCRASGQLPHIIAFSRRRVAFIVIAHANNRTVVRDNLSGIGLNLAKMKMTSYRVQRLARCRTVVLIFVFPAELSEIKRNSRFQR